MSLTSVAENDEAVKIGVSLRCFLPLLPILRQNNETNEIYNEEIVTQLRNLYRILPKNSWDYYNYIRHVDEAMLSWDKASSFLSLDCTRLLINMHLQELITRVNDFFHVLAISSCPQCNMVTSRKESQL